MKNKAFSEFDKKEWRFYIMKKIRIPKSLLPSPKKIAKRGLYEIMWGGNTKTRDYGKRLGK